MIWAGRQVAKLGAGMWSVLGIGPDDGMGPGCLPPPLPLQLTVQEPSEALLVCPCLGIQPLLRVQMQACPLPGLLWTLAPAQPRQGQPSHFMNK